MDGHSFPTRSGDATSEGANCFPASRGAFCLCTFPTEMRGSGAGGARHDPGMDDLTDDDMFLDMVDAIVLDALDRIGDDPAARYAFFKRFLALVQEVVGDAGKRRYAT